MRSRQLLQGTALSILVVSASVAVFWAIERWRGLGHVDHAEWIAAGPRGPALVVAGVRYESPDSGPSYYKHAWALLDAATGEELDREGFADSYESPGSLHSPKLLTAGGSRALLATGEGLHLRDLVTGEDLSGPALQALWPAIAAPWFQTRAMPRGLVLVEADDRQWWRLDLGSDASPERITAQEVPSGIVNDRCVSQSWARPGLPEGRVWAFQQVQTERHSDPSRWGLVAARALQYGQLDEIEPVGLRVPFGFFLCDERTGEAAVFGDAPGQGALVGLWTAEQPARVELARLSLEGTLVWRWASEVEAKPNLELEAFGHEGGFIVRVGSVIASLAADGAVRWRVAL